MKIVKKTVLVALFGAVLASTATANPADVPRVTEGLIAAGMATELGDQCGDVSVRMVRGVNFLWGLKAHLNDLGYTDAQIEAYIDNRAEKDRLEAIARQRLSDLGVRTDDPQSYCTVARQQIAQGTQVGQFLR